MERKLGVYVRVDAPLEQQEGVYLVCSICHFCLFFSHIYSEFN